MGVNIAWGLVRHKPTPHASLKRRRPRAQKRPSFVFLQANEDDVVVHWYKQMELYKPPWYANGLSSEPTNNSHTLDSESVRRVPGGATGVPR